ncbi:dehydrogenase/reductase SDR family member on chromosome X-like isoform X2 [Asparagus officinalis]|uniref:dehydrogenase/reductase SDR family member on chromosome X-like isoform X2 n=1 Tax=Asparagus officinalis TaxID=4686 RepID=UPI00098E2D0E|nr:dehydrogenase/reductase SDR family member on chromosome X-like isoform X2 [Asparagus officinalis]
MKMATDWSTAMKMLYSQEIWRMAIHWPLSLIYSYFCLFASHLFPFFLHSSSSSSYPRCRLSLDPESEIKQPICIVTGATSGLGAAAAQALAAEAYHVVLVGRSSQLLDQTIQEIKQKHKDAKLKAFQVDLASFPSIMKFESSLKQWLSESNLHPSVQLLINNAGIFAISCRTTADGYDQMMQTNYMGAFFLTKLLLPLLKNSPVASRIVNVTSFTHRSVFDIKVDQKTLVCLPTAGKYPWARIYEYSKLYLLLFSYELHRQLHAVDSSSTISVNFADPGAVETRIMRELPQCLSQLAFTILRCLFLLQSPEDGVRSIVDAALAPLSRGNISSVVRAGRFSHLRFPTMQSLEGIYGLLLMPCFKSICK